ncbi:Crp/Fnr family transcriptional regulator [Chloroflexota bacterium]
MNFNSKANILGSSSIFANLDDDELGELANLAIERSFAPNEFIFWDGDALEWVYIVTEGKVKVLKHSSLGKEFIVAFFSPGQMLGEVAIFENRSYPASAQAVTETKVVRIKTEDLLSFLANRPQVILRIISVLGGRLRDA